MEMDNSHLISEKETIASSMEVRNMQRCDSNGNGRHCVTVTEQNVWPAPFATPAPSVLATAAAALKPEPASAPISNEPATDEPTRAPVSALTGAPNLNNSNNRHSQPPSAASNEAFYEIKIVTKSPTSSTHIPDSSSASPSTGSTTLLPTLEPALTTIPEPTPAPSFILAEIDTELPTFNTVDDTNPTEIDTSEEIAQAPISDRFGEDVDNDAAFNFPTTSLTAQPTVQPTITPENEDDDLLWEFSGTNETTKDTNAGLHSNTDSDTEMDVTFMPSKVSTSDVNISNDHDVTLAASSSSPTSAPFIKGPTTLAPTRPSEATTGNANAANDQDSLLTAATSSPTSAPVISPVATLAPTRVTTGFETTSPTSNSHTNTQSLQCKANKQGNYGMYIEEGEENEAENELTKVVVEYRYQVETIPKFEITADDINGDMLQRLERAISDILVVSFFPPSTGHICLTPAVPASSSVVTSAATLRRGGERRRRLENHSTGTSGGVLGLTAEPADQVMEGGAGGHVDTPGCFVIDGALSIFTIANQNADDLSWVVSIVQTELSDAMNAGALDNVVPTIPFVRYIPSGTDLFSTGNKHSTSDLHPSTETSSSQKGEGVDGVSVSLSSPLVWSWILGGFGFVSLAIAAILGVAMYKRRRTRDEASYWDSPTNNSFASQGRGGSPRRSYCGSPLKRQRTPCMGAFPGNSAEIVDDNSESDDVEIYEDCLQDNGAVSTSSNESSNWGKVPASQSDDYSRLEINATDPNKPVVRPVLDEENETYLTGVV